MKRLETIIKNNNLSVKEALGIHMLYSAHYYLSKHITDKTELRYTLGIYITSNTNICLNKFGRYWNLLDLK